VVELERRSALAGHLTASAASAATGGPCLRELPPGGLALIQGAPAPQVMAQCLSAYGLGRPPAPGLCARGEDLRLLWVGPDQYLAACAAHREEALVRALATALEGHGSALVDLSHARTVLRIEGPRVRDILAKGCPLDVDSMQPDATAVTVLSHFNMLLHCEAEAAFDLYVARSYAVACYEWLLLAGREFGLRIESGA
jgi:sarcosine oxidase subunit gamma